MNGKIIREKGSKLGIRIYILQHNVEDNVLHGKVCYFPLDLIGSKKPKANLFTQDDHFIIPEPEFRGRYEVLTNPEDVNKMEDAIWAPIESLSYEEDENE